MAPTLRNHKRGVGKVFGKRLSGPSVKGKIDFMTAAQTIPLITIEQYLAAEEDAEIRHEYLGGYIYAMAGAKVIHNRITANAQGSLFASLRGKPCEAFNSDMKVRVEMSRHTRFYYPDAMVVCHSTPDQQTWQDEPVVIVEVASESTRRADQGEKREAYQSIPSLLVYLLVETDRPRVVVYRRTAPGPEGFEPELYEGIEAVVPLAEIEAELPLAELYQRIDFSSASVTDKSPDDAG